MKLLLRSIVYFVVACIAPLAAHAQTTTTWNNSVTSGSFTTDANWSNLAPNATTDAIISPSSGATLNITNANGSTELLIIGGGGTVNLSNTVGQTLTIAGEVPSGITDNADTINANSTLSLSGGGTVGGDFNFVEGNIEVGNQGGVGTLNITSGIVNFPTNFPDGSRFIIGSSGTGFVNQSGNSVVNTNARLYIGGSTLLFNNLGGTGVGTYTLSNNAQLTSGFVKMGSNTNPGDASTGTLTLSDSSSFTVTSGGELLVGTIEYSDTTPSTPTAGVVGGNATINQNDTSTVTLDGIAIFGSFNGTSALNPSTGTYNLNGGTLTLDNGSIATGGTLFGGATNAVGTLQQGGGSLIVTANTDLVFGGTSNTTVLPGVTGSGTGNYNLSGGTADISGALVFAATSGSTGTLTQTDGTLTGETGSIIFIGFAGTGTYNLSEAGTANLMGGMIVGGGDSTGIGVVNQSGGSMTVGTGLQIGGSVGSGTGTYNYSSGTFILTSGMSIGATGVFNQNGGTLTFNTAAQAIAIDAGGAYNVNSGATLDAGGNFITAGAGTGNLNFAGGTVAVTGSDWTDPLDGILSGTSTIDTTGGNATLSGNLTGNGTLDIIGGQTVALTGTNNVGTSWGAQINGAGTTLTAASVASLSATGSFGVGSGATLSINSSGNAMDTFAGTISGTGNFITGANDTAANTLVLTGNTNLTGASTTTIGANGFGTLEVDQGTISNVNGSAGNAADTFDVGDGTTTGTVSLLGTNILPQVTVNAGSTLFAQNIMGSVINNGTLGTLGTFATPSNLAITNNLTSTHTLFVNVNGTTADSFTATTATLSGMVQVTGIGSHTYDIVTTTGGITIGGDGNLNDAGGLATNPPTPLFRATLQLIDGDDVLQLTTVQHTVGSFAQTRNQAAVAEPIDAVINQGSPIPAGFQPLLKAFSSITSTSAIPGALDEVTPEVLQYARPIAYENATFLAQRMDNVDANLRNGYYGGGLDTSGLDMVTPGLDSSLGRSLGSLLAYNSPAFHSSAPNGVNYYPGAEGDAATPSTPTWDSSTQTISDSPNPLMATAPPSSLKMPAFSEFISGDIILADLNQNQSAHNAAPDKANYTSGNATAGVSFRMTSNLSAGVLFDYNHTDAQTDSSGSKTRVDTYSPGLYATYANRGFYANGLFAFGYSQYGNTRNIGLLGETASSNPNGTQYVGNLDFGYDFHPARAWTAGPSLGLTYTHVNIDAIQETGAPGADLNINSQDNGDDLRSEFGGHVMYQTHAGNILLAPNLTVLWQHEYLNLDGNSITSHFSDFGSTSFSTATAAPSKDSALIGCGLTATLDNSMSLYINYIVDAGASDYFAQSVIGGFKARF